MVDDHFTKKDDDINDRVQDQSPDDDADNILRAPQEQVLEQPVSPESPESPLSPMDHSLKPMFEQESVEIVDQVTTERK